MKYLLRLFFISLIACTTVIICNCNGSSSNKSKSGTDENDLNKDDQVSNTDTSDNSNTNLKILQLSVKGITCSSCKHYIENKLLEKSGIKSAVVSLEHQTNNLEIHYDPKKITPTEIKNIVNDSKFSVIDAE